jgi:hypothetical protein
MTTAPAGRLASENTVIIGQHQRTGGDLSPLVGRPAGGVWVKRRWRRAPADGYRRALVAAVRRQSMPASEPASRRMVLYGAFVAVGIILCGRGFSYWGLAPTPLYISEITIIAMVVYRPTRTYVVGLLRQVGRPGSFHLLAVTMVAFFVFGLAEVIRGAVGGGDPMSLIKSMPLYYYSLLIPLGLWMGSRDPKISEKVVWAVIWLYATYGVIYSVALSSLNLTIPGTKGAPVFDLGIAPGAVAVLGLLAYPRKTRWTIPLFFLDSAVMLGHEFRGEWVACLVAIVVYCLLTRRVRRAMQGLGLILAGVIIVLLIDIKIPGPPDRGGAVKPTDLLGRALGAFDPELAAKFTTSERIGGAAATADFRQAWWGAIWHSAISDPVNMFFGHGYAFNLQSLTPLKEVNDSVRSPHNIVMYSLGYTGFLGVALLALLLFAIAQQLWVAYRHTGNPAGLGIFFIMVVSTQFEPFLDSPFGAAALFLPVGMFMAPVLNLGGSERRVRPKRIEATLAANRVEYDPRPAPVPAQRRVASRAGRLLGAPGEGAGPGDQPARTGAPLRQPAALAIPASARSSRR